MEDRDGLEMQLRWDTRNEYRILLGKPHGKVRLEDKDKDNKL
jgi:hypothetical protein